MSSHPDEPAGEQSDLDAGEDKEGAGVEIGLTEGEGSTFEPEEDPEGHAG